MNGTVLESMEPVHLVWCWRLPADQPSVKVARDLVAAKADRCGLDAEAARLVVSELATNCVKHAVGSEDFVVTLRWQPDKSVIALVDNAPQLLPEFEPAAADPDRPDGRGLLIVAQAADEVEVRVGARSKAVCAVFSGERPRAPAGAVEPLAPIAVEPSDRCGYAYRLGLPPSDSGQAVGPLAVHITEAHAMNAIAALSRLRPVGERVATLLDEGAALARLLDAYDLQSLARAFAEHIGAAAAAMPER